MFSQCFSPGLGIVLLSGLWKKTDLAELWLYLYNLWNNGNCVIEIRIYYLGKREQFQYWWELNNFVKTASGLLQQEPKCINSHRIIEVFLGDPQARFRSIYDVFRISKSVFIYLRTINEFSVFVRAVPRIDVSILFILVQLSTIIV